MDINKNNNPFFFIQMFNKIQHSITGWLLIFFWLKVIPVEILARSIHAKISIENAIRI